MIAPTIETACASRDVHLTDCITQMAETPEDRAGWYVCLSQIRDLPELKS